MKTVFVNIIFIIAGIYNSIQAQETEVFVSDKTGWHMIGESIAKFTKESDEVMIRGSDKFACVKFKIIDAPIDLASIVLYFDNDENQKNIIGMPIKLEGESRIIDLQGGERDIKKVVFIYKTLPNIKDMNACIEIWGLKKIYKKGKKV